MIRDIVRDGIDINVTVTYRADEQAPYVAEFKFFETFSNYKDALEYLKDKPVGERVNLFSDGFTYYRVNAEIGFFPHYDTDGSEVPF